MSIFRQSLPIYESALQIAEAVVDQDYVIQVLHTLGDAVWGLEDSTRALDYYERALALVGQIIAGWVWNVRREEE